ncbi:PIG-U-domain-containing protein [Armillaria gallica]|uniref:PIG-U-domain-containing protein n=1 Tax=Armillaria gallica TaxID=47427 RepID=A0A2H3DRU5_ARMGA|nr:PIG-U-domain-containing protein [Armillaria gallica]
MPNPGLWWHFFIEMFDHFCPFFLTLFSVHLLIYIAPICIKFQHDTLYATFLLVGVLDIFKAYPTPSDHPSTDQMAVLLLFLDAYHPSAPLARKPSNEASMIT